VTKQFIFTVKSMKMCPKSITCRSAIYLSIFQ